MYFFILGSTFSDHTTKPWKEKNDLSRGTTKTSLDDYNMVTAEDDSIKDDENQIDNDINADTDNFGVYDIEEESEDNVTESHINSEKDQNEFDTYNLEEEINDTNAANDVHDDGNAKIDVDNAKEESYDAIVQDNKESQGNNLVEENNQPLLQDQKAILEVEINQTAKRIEEIEEKPDKMNTSVDNVADDFVNSSKINDTNYSNDESIGFDIAENRQVVDEKPDTSVVQLNDKDGESDSLLAQPIILEHGVDGENGNKLEERETNSELDQTDYIRNDDGSNHLLLRRLRSTDPPNITFDKDIKQHTVHSRDSQTNTEIHDKHKDNHEADPIIVYNVKEQHNHKSTTNPNNFQENINQVSLKNSYTLKSEKDAQVKYDQGILKTINPLLKTIKESIKTSHNQLGHLNDDQTHENDNSQGKFVQEIIQDNHQEQALQANMIARENAHERVIQQILKSGKSGKENYKHENVQMIGNVHEQVNQENLETRDNNQERNIQARIEEEEDTIQEQVFHKHLETRSGAHNQNISENLGTKDSAKKQVIQELTETEDVAQEQVIHTNVETGDIQENLEIRNNSEEQNTQGSIETGDRVLEQVFQENVETGDSAQEQVIQGNMKVSNQVQKVHTGGNVAKSKHAQNSSHTKANDDSSENVRSTQMHEKTENPNEISYNTSHIKTNNNLIEKHKKVTLKNNSIYKAGIKIGNEKDDSQTVTVKYLETDKSKTHRDNVRQKRSIVHI